MRKLNVYVVASAILLTILAGVAVASHHGETKKQKKAILLFAFGSSEESAQISFENIDKSVKTAYLNVSVKWAYTSHIIRKKLVSQGKLLDSPEISFGQNG